ncbi:hypothetical protein BJ508DRAFT_302658 [Ascobolus immersus RN42]|uniref:F-box domain-containing protein n=1 Tax=Ascobolus immersus RN42 TaxID=1160509 RepID=A0A3N4IJL7_ASCIM|nr:hypothetical protein BJ508DRAFT_302658 [Ascobolus immersus RN42]
MSTMSSSAAVTANQSSSNSGPSFLGLCDRHSGTPPDIEQCWCHPPVKKRPSIQITGPSPIGQLPNELLHEICIRIPDPRSFLALSRVNRRLSSVVGTPYTRQHFTREWFETHCNDVVGPEIFSFITRFIRLHASVHYDKLACAPYEFHSYNNNMTWWGYSYGSFGYLLGKCRLPGLLPIKQDPRWRNRFLSHLRGIPIPTDPAYTLSTMPLIMEDAVLAWYMFEFYLCPEPLVNLNSLSVVGSDSYPPLTFEIRGMKCEPDPSPIRSGKTRCWSGDIAFSLVSIAEFYAECEVDGGAGDTDIVEENPNFEVKKLEMRRLCLRMRRDEQYSAIISSVLAGDGLERKEMEQ